MVYVQFYVNDKELLGSDGVYILDGRNNFHNMINDCYERVNKLRFVQPNINSFQIFKGKFSDSKPISKKIYYKHE